MTKFLGHISNAQRKSTLGYVQLVAEYSTPCDSSDVSDAASGIKATIDTSLEEAANVTLPDSQEHGEPSSEQQ